jgi:hypothetical protein
VKTLSPVENILKMKHLFLHWHKLTIVCIQAKMVFKACCCQKKNGQFSKFVCLGFFCFYFFTSHLPWLDAHELGNHLFCTKTWKPEPCDPQSLNGKRGVFQEQKWSLHWKAIICVNLKFWCKYCHFWYLVFHLVSKSVPGKIELQ